MGRKLWWGIGHLKQVLFDQNTGVTIEEPKGGSGVYEFRFSKGQKSVSVKVLRGNTDLDPRGFIVDMNYVHEALQELGVKADLPRNWLRATADAPKDARAEEVEGWQAIENLKSAAGGRDAMQFGAPAEGEKTSAPVMGKRSGSETVIIYPMKVTAQDGRVHRFELHAVKDTTSGAIRVSKSEVAAAAYAFGVDASGTLGPGWQQTFPKDEVLQDYIDRYGEVGVTGALPNEKGKEEADASMVDTWAARPGDDGPDREDPDEREHGDGANANHGQEGEHAHGPAEGVR